MSTVTGKAIDFTLLKRIFKYALPYKPVLFFTTLLTIILAGSSIIRPVLISHTVDEYIVKFDREGLLFMTLMMLGVLILEGILQFYQSYYSDWLGQNVIKDLRVQLSKHVLQFKLKYFDRTPIGALVTRVVSDIETIADVFSQGFISIAGDILKLLVIVSFMLWKNWQLSLIVLIPVPVLLFATYIFKNVIKSAFQEVRTQVSKLNAFVQEHLTGMNIVQIFNREEIELDKFQEMNKKHRNAHIKTVWAYSIYLPVVEMLSASSIGLLVWWGAGDVLEGKATLGVLLEYILYIHMLYRPIRQLADRFNVLQMGMVSSERVFKVLDTDDRIERTGSLTSSDIEGNIEIKNLWFAYQDEDWVLKNVCLSIPKGKSVALVGATGAGKSSIINLLGRFYEYNKGELLIDGKNVREYDLDLLRQSMAVVLQDVFLFSDTIFNNITLFSPNISREEVIAAAKEVGAHDFIMKLPGGYDFDVKERGGLLSVGQRQIISFIRAYVHHPKILILDEATSSIDSESEMLIQNATKVLTQGRTSILVAHRLSTIQTADTIVVLEKGEIIESGSHNELLSKNGHYKKLYDLQFKKQEVIV